LPLEAFGLVNGFELHDVWLVELDGAMSCTVQDLRSLITRDRLRSLSPAVRALFLVRSVVGRILRLDSPSNDQPARGIVETIPTRLVRASLVPTGTPEGPFTTLYVLPAEAAYEALNATVHAILVVALTTSDAGHRFFWATYLRPVGAITSIYMGLIDPFRRTVVYPGLESWLKRAWRESCRTGIA
jgi:hypothetical protein